MAVLQDGDFELDGYLFSGSRAQPLYVQGVGLSFSGDRTQDVLNPFGEDVQQGRDFRVPPLWSFGLRVGHGEAGAALANLAALTRAWNKVAAVPGAESVLRYAIAGRTRLVYGRARELFPDFSQVFDLGRVVATAKFQTKDTWHYADEMQSLTVGLIPVNSGGLKAPLRAPLRASPGGSRQGLVSISGDAPAPVEVVFKGPVLNPVASSTGWQIGLNASLAYDQSVTINARTGTVLRNDGVSLAGALTRRTYLPEARLRPGSREIVFAGTDPSGLSSCTIRWRNTFYSF